MTIRNPRPAACNPNRSMSCGSSLRHTEMPCASAVDPLAEPDVVTTTTPQVTYVVVDDAELEKPFRVIIENDDVTPMEFVVMVLVFVFELTYDRSVEVMLEAHTNGRAHVVTLPFEEAQRRVYAAQSSAREAGYPLSFYLEPEE